MTLIVTLVNNNRIVQVSDRRLTTLTGEIYDDGANKAIAVGMSYVHFTTCYTGLAFIGRAREENRTDRWLQEQLGAICRSGEQSLETICESLSQRATDAISRLRGDQRNKGLKVVMAGFDRENRPFRATVSNIRFSSHDIFDVRDRFTWDVRRYHPWNPMPDIDVAGAMGAFEAKDNHAKRLKKIRSTVARQFRRHDSRLNDEQAARRLVTLVRAASTHPAYGHLIGRDCLSVVAVPKTPSMDALYSMSVAPSEESSKGTPFEGFYHPMAATTVLYGPLLVDPYMDTLSVEVDLDPQVPEIPAQEDEAIQETERERMRQRLVEYTVAFYEEVRRQVQMLGPSDPEQVPHFFRDHKRMIVITECADGYIVSHRSDPYNRRDKPVPETFEVYSAYQDRTVGDVAQTGYPPHSDFRVSMFPHVRENESGKYAPYADPEHQEGIEYISNNRVAEFTPEAAREDAQKQVWEFFEQNPEVTP
jgi:hypothetical protein